MLGTVYQFHFWWALILVSFFRLNNSSMYVTIFFRRYFYYCLPKCFRPITAMSERSWVLKVCDNGCINLGQKWSLLRTYGMDHFSVLFLHHGDEFAVLCQEIDRHTKLSVPKLVMEFNWWILHTCSDLVRVCCVRIFGMVDQQKEEIRQYQVVGRVGLQRARERIDSVLGVVHVLYGRAGSEQ